MVMARSRGVDAEEPKADDLEIVSVGSLYRGPWDKKYWTCSRGKDRYPYPVGYHAVRFHEGSICKLEILEDSKGPLFTITSADGHSCSGQTPTIAWKKFQKNGVPRLKIWHGKRSSCKIDGLEFFGFKNPFVQRLLRELVTDVNETADQILLSPSYCNGASVTQDESEHAAVCPESDLLAFLPKPQTTGKRSQRHDKIVKDSEKAATCERVETREQREVKVTYSRKKRQKNSKSTESMVFPTPKEDLAMKDSRATLPETASLSNISDACELLKAAEEVLRRKSSADCSSCLGREAASEENSHKVPETCRSTAFEDNISLDRLHDEMDPPNSSILNEPINEEGAFVKDSEGIADAVLFVDDTLAESRENEPTAANTASTGGFVADTHPEEEVDTYHSGGSSERSEFDSVGEEAAKSMMSLLLPQAVPLLKKGSKKKYERKAKTSSVENPSNDSKLLESDNADYFANVSVPVAGVKIASVVDAKVFDEVREAGNGNHSHIPSASLPNRKYESPLRKSLVDTDSENCYLLKTCPADGSLSGNQIFGVATDEQTNNSRSHADESLLDGQPNASCRENPIENDKVKVNAVPIVSGNQTSNDISSGRVTFGSTVPSASNFEKSQSCGNIGLNDTLKSNNFILHQRTAEVFPEIKSFIAKDDQAESHHKLDGGVKIHDDIKGILQLVGCYSHPLPVISVLLRNHGSELYLCVQCGLLVDEGRTLFLYKLLTEEPRIGCPSNIGQTSVLHPNSDPSFGRIMPERSCFELTPDGQNLILLGNIKTPHCREKRIACSCSKCASVSSDDNTVRIVQVNTGYVTILVNLQTVDRILSLLVCEPSYLVATGESGRLHSWIMNPTWSAQMEEFDLPNYDSISPGIVDLKKVPKHASLVVGYNGFGEFSVWDISRRISLSKFTALGTLVHRFLPISSLSLRRKDTAPSNSNMDEHINEIMTATTKLFKESNASHSRLPLEGEEVAFWLLASAVSDDYLENASDVESVAAWRLALLAKNAMILGSPLDSRAAAVAPLSGYGVIGTRDGLVYLWELCTGRKIGTLHHFEGKSISCIATDDSTSSVLAICGGNGELMVYRRPQVRPPYQLG